MRKITLTLLAIAITFTTVIVISSCKQSANAQTDQPVQSSPTSEEREQFEEWAAAGREQMAISDYEGLYMKWTSDEYFFLEWLDSGEEYDECREAIIEWAIEIQTYPISDVPDSYKSTHDQLLRRASELRASVS